MNHHDFIGVDIAKEKFDVCLLNKAGTSLQKVFDNTEQGFKEFLTWINKQGKFPWVCMEATGYYSETLAYFLTTCAIQVSVVNPIQIKYFSKVKLSRNKNDKIDAKIIAEYCAVMKPGLFKSRTSEQKYIRELIQLEDTLKTQSTQLKLQMGCSQSLPVKKEFEKTIKLLKKRLTAHAETIRSTIEKKLKWQHLVHLLTSIKGFGLLSAYRFLAYLPDFSLFSNAKQLAAFIGVFLSFTRAKEVIFLPS